MSEGKDAKRFGDWIELKESLHNMDRVRTFHEGEIWWCAMGENVGVEINGKSSTFARPVLIFKKLSRYGFLAIPLTSQSHAGSWYASFRFQGREQVAVLAQIRVISVARLYRKIGSIDDSDKIVIREAFRALYLPG